MNIIVAIVVFAIIAVGGASRVFASSGTPDDLIMDKAVIHVTPSLDLYKGWFKAGSKYGPPYATWRYPVGFLVQHPLPTAARSLKLKMHWDGYNADQSGCPTWDFGRPGYIVIKNCPDYYPAATAHYAGGVRVLGYGGYFHGDSNAWRFTTAVDKVKQLWGPLVDWQAGIEMAGNSYGGATVLLQSVMFRDVNPRWQAAITKVHAYVPPLYFFRPEDPATPFVEAGKYWRDPGPVIAWKGYDTDNADLIRQAHAVRHIYYSFIGSPRDEIGFDPRFFRDFCDAKKIACFALWADQSHDLLPDNYSIKPYDGFAGPHQDVRLDQVIQVFTNATSNRFGGVGWYNAGLSWDSRKLVETASMIKTPLRYKRHVNIYPDVPDQPRSSTFDFTLRNREGSTFKLAPHDVVHWSLGKQQGDATVTEAGEVTIQGLTLASSDDYTTLTVTR